MEMRTVLELADGADDVASTVRFKERQARDRPIQLIISKAEWEALGRPDTVSIAVMP